MEERHPIPLPVERVESMSEPAWHEVSAAVALVAEGGATRVTIANVEITDDLAGNAAALCQRKGVAFAVDRDTLSGRRALRVGPRI